MKGVNLYLKYMEAFSYNRNIDLIFFVAFRQSALLSQILCNNTSVAGLSRTVSASIYGKMGVHTLSLNTAFGATRNMRKLSTSGKRVGRGSGEMYTDGRHLC